MRNTTPYMKAIIFLLVVCLLLLLERKTAMPSGTADEANCSLKQNEDSAVADAGPCAEVLTYDENDTATMQFGSLIPVLKLHCEARPDLALEEFLPDISFFQKIVNATQSYPSPISLFASRGTTGLRTFTDLPGFVSVQYSSVHHQPAESGPKCHALACMQREASSWIAQMPDVINKIRGDDMHPPAPTKDNYEQLLQLQVDGLTRLLSCGDCGHLIIMDSPYVNFLAELYLALGPNTKVVFLQRDARAWAESRKRHHNQSTTGLVCAEGKLPNPFSYSQCARNRSHGTDFWNTDFDVLRKSYSKFDAYVHRLVRTEYLLDLDVFSSKITTADRQTWSDTNKEMLSLFLS